MCLWRKINGPASEKRAGLSYLNWIEDCKGAGTRGGALARPREVTLASDAKEKALRFHGRYDYLPITRRPVYDWPGGVRLAVYLAIRHAPAGPGGGYGSRVGAWRLLDLLYELALPASALVEAALLDECPELPRAHLMRGDELVAAGPGRRGPRRLGDRARPPDEAEAAVLVRAATEALARAAGAPPRGWFAPPGAAGEALPDLLQEAGYAYLLDAGGDDQPIWLRTRAGRLLAVPRAAALDDARGRGRLGADAFADRIVDDLDERLRQAESGPLVMGITLDPATAGQPHRLRHLRRALRHVLAHQDRLWLATAGAVAAHAAPHAP
jgi:peptidoglycan/xylan/chitin deacetylase (PgdA/CDA1 family)